MTRFEAQYNEMGKRYTEMGELLTQMKTAVEENRERSEQEIRRELLDEIQRNILQSIPKRWSKTARSIENKSHFMSTDVILQ